MSRRKAAPKRTLLPDPLFGSQLIAKFVNCVMRDGKKSVAERIVYDALELVAKRARGKDGDEGDAGGKGGGSIRHSAASRKVAMDSFEQALENLRPNVEVKSRRVGGSTYQIPVEVKPNRRTALAMRWLSEYASQRGEKTMVDRLANEILDAMQSRGNAAKKREDTHRMAKANQAFAHYRW